MARNASGWVCRGVVFSMLVVVAFAAGATTDVETLLKESDRARGGDFPGLVWVIAIDSHEADREDHQVLSAQAQGTRTRVEYTAPEKIKGQNVLMLGRNMWFAKPGLQKPVPISPRQRLLGQAANGDIASTNYAADYSVSASGEESINGEACAVLELVAREKNTTYDRIRYWVSLSRKVGVKAEFYTVSGKHFKTATFEYGNQLSYEGKQLPMVSRMTIVDALNPVNVTTMRYSDIAVRKINSAVFELNQ